MLDPYLWLKWAHIVSVISWMAGLLYLPRLFVYHSERGSASVEAQTFKVMERRLYRGIMTPAMAASWLFGLGVAWVSGIGFAEDVWFAVKLGLVIGLSAFHVYLGAFVKAFARDEQPRDARFFRLINEVPTVAMLGVVFLVVFKPF